MLFRLETDSSAFNLELSMMVGATNGYFPDNLGNKPWQDSSPLAMSGEYFLFPSIWFNSS